MRITKISLILAIAFAFAPLAASAQMTSDQQPAVTGWVDFGVRGNSLTGDASRYERYRDLGEGLFMEGLRLNSETNGWLINLMGDHVGRKDQRYRGTFVRPGKFKGYAMWDQIPMLLSRTTRTPYSEVNPGEFRLPDAVQLQLQNLSSSARPAALLDLVNGSPLFDLKSRRHSAEGGFEFLPVPEASIKLSFKSTTREGAQVRGASFGHGQVDEFAEPIDHKLTDFNGSAELQRGKVLLRAGFDGSWFTNNITSVIVDNPLRATDVAGTSSAARLSVPVSNNRVGVNGMVSVTMPKKTRLTGYVAVSSLKDDNGMVLPQTINSAVAGAAGAPDRSAINGDATIKAAHLSFSSRPSPLVNVNVKYRYFDFDNKTPQYHQTLRVSYDGNVTTRDVHSEPFGLTRNQLDADVRFTPAGPVALTVGASRNEEDRTYRIFESTVDKTFRVKADTFESNFISLRTMYEYSERRGSGFDEELLLEVSEQPGMRHFDVADRNRSRFTMTGAFTGVPNWVFSVSAAVGRDDYLESEFGLRDNNHNIYAAGFDATPSDRVNFGLSYSFEDYNTLQRSRQAGNSATEKADPARNWATDADDKVHSVLANMDILDIGEKLDLFMRMDYNRTRAHYNYILGAVVGRTLPEEAIVPTILDAPTALPVVKSDLTRASVDAVYEISKKVSFGVTYWFDKYAVEDFTLDAEAQSAVNTGNNILLYYTYTPYTAHTTWGRFIVRW